jgi:hypothetical protein
MQAAQVSIPAASPIQSKIQLLTWLLFGLRHFGLAVLTSSGLADIAKCCLGGLRPVVRALLVSDMRWLQVLSLHNDQLSQDAKLTQIRYGTSSAAARPSKRWKETAVNAMAIHSTCIS